MTTKATEYLAAIAKHQFITLPESGIEVRVRKANAFWFIENMQTLPIGTGADVHAAAVEIAARATHEDIVRNFQFTRKLIHDHVLDPKVRENPNYEDNEIAFEDLLPGDTQCLIDYLVGTKGAGGEPIDGFPKQPIAADAGSGR